MKKQLLILFFVLLSTNIIAQNGTIRGKVLESTTGEGAIAATVKITGGTTNLGVFTDLDGSFTFNIPSGSYEIEITYIGFENTKITGIEVSENNVTLIPDITLAEANTQLKEVVVTAKLLKTSEEAITIMKRKSPVMMDGISAAKMKLIGDATAVEAAKRVTGVSIEGGKYVYVRGLGDRYSKTTLNGLDIPGLDPDRNSLQMDIFPTALVDNITVSKNFLPNMPADFTGGLLNIETKDFPENKIFNVSASVGFNPSMHFNNDFILGNKGANDWLGMDDGTRALPEIARISNDIPTPISGAPKQAVTDFVKSFNPNLAVQKQRSFLDYSFGVSYGNQIDLNKDGSRPSNPKLGYIGALSYKFDQKLFQDVIYGEFQKNINDNVNEMTEANNLTGTIGEESVLIGALGGLAFKTNFTKIQFNAMRLQSGENKGGQFSIYNNSDAVGQSGFLASSDNIEYGERSVTNFQLSGSTVVKNSGLKIDWAAGTTLSTAVDPDIRKTAFTLDPSRTYFNAGAGGNPSRIWRYLDENNTSFKIDIEKKINKKNTFRLGGLYVSKERNYEIKFYNIQFFGAQQRQWEPDANSVLLAENIYPSNKNNIYYISANSDPNSNQYNSIINNLAFYAMDEIDINDKLKGIIGIRTEQYTQFHTGRDQRYASGDLNGKNLDNAKVLDQLNLFPSVNLIQKLGDKTNLRASYTKTTARPSFKELSFAQIIDPLTNRIFNGSLFSYPGSWEGNLVPTMIDNVDLRWEKFYTGADILSFSFFYKKFQDPIELVRIPQQQTSTEYQPRNVGNGQLYGFEFEVNKSLLFIAPALEKFSFNSNITLVNSAITMTDVEYNARESFMKVGETLKKTRPMGGQSPVIVNAGLTYGDFEKGINMGLFYNVKGPTLSIVGSGLFPDIYAVPYHNLSFSFNKSFGKDQKMSINFKTENILNDAIEVVYKAYQAQDQPFSVFRPGRSFSFGFGYRF